MSYEREHLAQALDLLEQAIDREPRYGPALALAAAYRANVDNYDWADSRDEEENRRAPVDLAREALRAAADDPGVLGRAAMVPGRFGEDIDAALALIDRALVLNPLCLWLVLERLAAPVRWTGGTRDRAFRDLDAPQSARSEGVPFCRVGIAHFVSHRFEDALAALRISLEEVSAFSPAYRALAACCAHMGRLDEARSILKRLTVLTPVVVHDCEPIPPSGGWRAISFGLAPGGRRGGMSQTRRLEAILSADAAGYSLPMGTTRKARSNSSKHRQLLDPRLVLSKPPATSPPRAARPGPR